MVTLARGKISGRTPSSFGKTVKLCTVSSLPDEEPEELVEGISNLIPGYDKDPLSPE
jgi:hypothetical protein